MHRAIVRAGLLGGLLCAGLAPAAHAASANVFHVGTNECGSVVRYQYIAAPGETNNVVVGATGERRLALSPGGCASTDPFALPAFATFASLSAPVSSDSCVQVRAVVSCSGFQVVALLVVLDDGNDTAIVGNTGQLQAFVHAGDGDDTVSVRNRRGDVVTCGDGQDTVYADQEDEVAEDCETVS